MSDYHREKTLLLIGKLPDLWAEVCNIVFATLSAIESMEGLKDALVMMRP